ncbi:hypothetical protein [Dongia rigui]|uniref:Uncharacterized protein n=1 Tax=Dongia rigui TaxID=940149 RepID=A0ABU5E573_9PROT|nr:hypothetical protein [Dongia rigui]MDY0874517.1 hypothetical protein [Dongia rigui]
MKRAVKVSLIASAVLGVVLLAGAFWLESQFGGTPPEIADGLSPQFVEGSISFNERVKARFPAGTPEGELIDTLRAQGFSIDVDQKMARFEQRGLICKLVWQVSWKMEQLGAISNVDGAYWGVCI